MIPYIVGHPIKNRADFYGRSLAIRRFYEVIAGQQAQSLSVVGARRAGKTSFLLHVAHPEMMQQHLAEPEQTVMVYLDMSFCKTPAEFYGRLAQRLQQALSGSTSRQKMKMRAANAHVAEDLLYEFGNRRVVLLLDEFDQLRVGNFTEDFLTELRALIGNWDYDMACVTASYWSLYQLGSHIGLPPTSPFYNIFYPSPIYIAGLEAGERCRLICQPAQRAGLALASEDVVAIEELAGTLPFFVQATAAAWFRDKEAGMLPDFAEQLEQLTRQLSPYFAQWWRVMDEAERAVLQKAVAGGASGMSSRLLVQARQRLLRYGLLTGREGETAVNGVIFAQWIAEHAADADTPTSSVTNGVTQSYNLKTLRQTLVQHFSLEELHLLSFDLGMDFDQFPGKTKGAKARDLLVHSERRGQLADLVAAIRFERGQDAVAD